jgi:hypothetical protein
MLAARRSRFRGILGFGKVLWNAARHTLYPSTVGC